MIPKCAMCNVRILSDNALGWQGKLFGRDIYICRKCFEARKYDLENILRRMLNGIGSERMQV